MAAAAPLVDDLESSLHELDELAADLESATLGLESSVAEDTAIDESTADDADDEDDGDAQDDALRAHAATSSAEPDANPDSDAVAAAVDAVPGPFLDDDLLPAGAAAAPLALPAFVPRAIPPDLLPPDAAVPPTRLSLPRTAGGTASPPPPITIPSLSRRRSSKATTPRSPTQMAMDPDLTEPVMAESAVVPEDMTPHLFWVPAHQHPEIAPLAFKDWLDRHDMQLTNNAVARVRRRKSYRESVNVVSLADDGSGKAHVVVQPVDDAAGSESDGLETVPEDGPVTSDGDGTGHKSDSGDGTAQPTGGASSIRRTTLKRSFRHRPVHPRAHRDADLAQTDGPAVHPHTQGSGSFRRKRSLLRQGIGAGSDAPDATDRPSDPSVRDPDAEYVANSGHTPVEIPSVPTIPTIPTAPDVSIIVRAHSPGDELLARPPGAAFVIPPERTTSLHTRARPAPRPAAKEPSALAAEPTAAPVDAPMPTPKPVPAPAEDAEPAHPDRIQSPPLPPRPLEPVVADAAAPVDAPMPPPSLSSTEDTSLPPALPAECTPLVGVDDTAPSVPLPPSPADAVVAPAPTPEPWSAPAAGPGPDTPLPAPTAVGPLITPLQPARGRSDSVVSVDSDAGDVSDTASISGKRHRKKLFGGFRRKNSARPSDEHSVAVAPADLGGKPAAKLPQHPVAAGPPPHAPAQTATPPTVAQGKPKKSTWGWLFSSSSSSSSSSSNQQQHGAGGNRALTPSQAAAAAASMAAEPVAAVPPPPPVAAPPKKNGNSIVSFFRAAKKSATAAVGNGNSSTTNTMASTSSTTPGKATGILAAGTTAALLAAAPGSHLASDRYGAGKPRSAALAGHLAIPLRYPIHIERAICRLAHQKLANPRRPLCHQVLISNMLVWYMSLRKAEEEMHLAQQAQLAAAAAAGGGAATPPAAPAAEPAHPASGWKAGRFRGSGGGGKKKRSRKAAGAVPGGARSAEIVVAAPSYSAQGYGYPDQGGYAANGTPSSSQPSSAQDGTGKSDDSSGSSDSDNDSDDDEDEEESVSDEERRRRRRAAQKARSARPRPRSSSRARATAAAAAAAANGGSVVPRASSGLASNPNSDDEDGGAASPDEDDDVPLGLVLQKKPAAAAAVTAPVVAPA
ncbi:hypothetical protein AMAG_04715 [Allomyces macrogynus ATCC 38327]|uniref:Protein Zds1 C-terminal domain-containing protein n=1 Tax=Allomyces macrogynus (strain ATCC 38327) TaxID=578462 RepID=A0A0L0S5Y8_ALLM3|nr:hypothetical protein AMAG_04715 [Allomyces macrogynus ATCC 38327]|eukprot:KNE57870.1 hypothetical protein AMAG_04715 [Allomyces macrogynus ATCC 38327]